MMQEVFTIHGTARVVHADRGTSMTSKTVAALLTDLGVIRSHSRPRVSNDDPFSQAWFKTLKYAPVFPDRFVRCGTPALSSASSCSTTTTSTTTAPSGCTTRADVRYGFAADADQRRRDTLAAAQASTPNRFTSGADPKILDLPDAAWINPPTTQTEDQEQEPITAAA